MELKHIQNKIVKHTILCFNRTFMELKHEQYRGLKLENDSFNRTFMELKRKLTFRRWGEALNSFNRTFMELKRANNQLAFFCLEL